MRCEGAIAIQLDVTDTASIASAAEWIREEAGRLDLLVNSTAISTTRNDVRDLTELLAISRASTAPSTRSGPSGGNVLGALAI